MKILVTGAGGFIGSHLVELLVKNGYEVKAFLRYNSRNHWGWLENSDVRDHIDFQSGDIRDFDSVSNAVQNCEAVFHLAALIGIPYSYISPKAYIETNITGTYNILQAARENQLTQVLVTSTSETYGTAQYIPIDEKHPLVGQSPYSASKIGADQLATSYYRSFGLPVKIVRPFNTYGPRQSARAIIPTVISQLLSGKTSLKLGNLSPTRDLTYVTDTCNGFLEVFKNDSLIGEMVNIGMNSEISIGELAEKIAEIMGQPLEIVQDNSRIRPENSEVERLFCNNAKLMDKTKWQPAFSLDTGLSATIDWAKKNSNFFKADIYNV